MRTHLSDDDVTLIDPNVRDAIINANGDWMSIGADPEGALFDPVSSTIIRADSKLSSSGRIGADGAGAPIELRPGTFNAPDALTKEIIDMILEAEKLTDCLFLVDGNEMATGAHIHFGSETPGYRYPHALMDTVCRGLKATILDHVYCLNGARRGGYKDSYYTETKNYGWEYRAFPSGIMADPMLLEDVITCSYIVAAGGRTRLRPESIRLAEALGRDIASGKKIRALTGEIVRATSNVSLRPSDYWSPVFREIASEFVLAYPLQLAGRAEQAGRTTNTRCIGRDMGWGEDPDFSNFDRVNRGRLLWIPHYIRHGEDRAEIIKLFTSIKNWVSYY